MDSVVTLEPGVERLTGVGSTSILRKAFAILGTFRSGRSALSLSQISRRSGLPKSTVHRVIGMLTELGAVERRGEYYRVGPAMFSISARSPQVALREAAAPHVRALAATTRQTVQLAVLRDADVLYLDKVGGQAPTPVAAGDRLPAHTTALGKAILAYSDDATTHAVLSGPLERRTPTTVVDRALLAAELRDARTARVARDRQEVVAGLRCVAVPVLVRGQAVAAISVAYPARYGSGHMFVGPLQETARRVAHALPHGELLAAG